MIVRFKKLHPDAIVPRYHSAGAAGCDLYAVDDILADTCRYTLVGTGIAIELPHGHEAQVRPRSSLSKAGIHVVLGTIDSDFRGEIAVLMATLGGVHYHVHAGDRIAQLVIAPVVRAEFVEADELTETARGSGGFGSTGK